MITRAKKISVIGDTGSGKTTFAQVLAEKLDLPFYEADKYRFKNGIKRPDEDYLQDIAGITSEGKWVFDGAHTIAASIAWTRADLVLYLKFPIRILFFRTLKRAIKRLVRGEKYVHGGKESLHNLFGKEGLIRNFYSKIKERRAGYQRQFEKIGINNINLIIVRSPAELEKYLVA
jgi:adenylate kinase family enzyme